MEALVVVAVLAAMGLMWGFIEGDVDFQMHRPRVTVLDINDAYGWVEITVRVDQRRPWYWTTMRWWSRMFHFRWLFVRPYEATYREHQTTWRDVKTGRAAHRYVDASLHGAEFEWRRQQTFAKRDHDAQPMQSVGDA